VLDDEETDDDLQLLLAPGSSLGGARPKASVRDQDGDLLIAKFPKKDDEISVPRWEALALTLARRVGISVEHWRLETVAGRDVLLVRRFDRAKLAGAHRIPFLSAMSMIGAADGETHSYLEIADALRQHGASTRADLVQLWRRIVFNVLISNTDDHLRNHGFLYAGTDGWRLSPAYDMNPVPVDVKARVLTTAIGYDEDTQASLDIALGVAGDFGIAINDARKIAGDVGRVVRDWREIAKELGLRSGEIERMATAFEHRELALALAG
jgi:serine/threonine-protein kinase HipA